MTHKAKLAKTRRELLVADGFCGDCAVAKRRPWAATCAWCGDSRAKKTRDWLLRRASR